MSDSSIQPSRSPEEKKLFTAKTEKGRLIIEAEGRKYSIAQKRTGLIGEILNIFTRIRAGKKGGFVELLVDGKSWAVNRASLEKQFSRKVTGKWATINELFAVTISPSGREQESKRMSLSERESEGVNLDTQKSEVVGVDPQKREGIERIAQGLEELTGNRDQKLAKLIHRFYREDIMLDRKGRTKQTVIEELKSRNIKVIPTGGKIYLAGKPLAKGTFKKVSRAFELISLNSQALSQIRSKIDTFEAHAEVATELGWSKELGEHSNFIRYHEFEYGKQIGLLSEFADGGDLWGSLSSAKPEELANYTRDVFEGLKHMKQLGLVHNDLKLDNILVVKGRAKITDYGFMQNVWDDYRNIAGTPGYMAPEIEGGVIMWGDMPKTDNYAFGMILLEMATRGEFKCKNYATEPSGKIPNIYLSRNQIQRLQRHLIFQNNPLASLIANLIEFDPNKRYSLEDVELKLANADLEEWFREPLTVPPAPRSKQ